MEQHQQQHQSKRNWDNDEYNHKKKIEKKKNALQRAPTQMNQHQLNTTFNSENDNQIQNVY